MQSPISADRKNDPEKRGREEAIIALPTNFEDTLSFSKEAGRLKSELQKQGRRVHLQEVTYRGISPSLTRENGAHIRKLHILAHGSAAKQQCGGLSPRELANHLEPILKDSTSLEQITLQSCYTGKPNANGLVYARELAHHIAPLIRNNPALRGKLVVRGYNGMAYLDPAHGRNWTLRTDPMRGLPSADMFPDDRDSLARKEAFLAEWAKPRDAESKPSFVVPDLSRALLRSAQSHS